MVNQPFPVDTRLLGARQRPFDPREMKYALTPTADIDLGVAYSVTQGCPSWVFNQLSLGSCTANAASMAAVILQYLTDPTIDPVIASRLFLYAEARIKEGTFPQDAGAYVADALDAALPGLVPEALEPYVADPTIRPTAAQEQIAASGQHKVIASHAPIYAGGSGVMVQGIAQALAAGHPVQIGMDWHHGDFNPVNGILPTGTDSGQSVGGHSVVIVKSVPARVGRWPLLFLTINSWGAEQFTHAAELQQIDPDAKDGWFFIPASLIDAGRVWDARAVVGVNAAPKPQPNPTDPRYWAQIAVAAGTEVVQQQAVDAGKTKKGSNAYLRYQGGSQVLERVKAAVTYAG